MRIARVLLCGLVAAHLPPSLGVGRTNTICSVVSFGRLKSDSQPYFIGIALSDTLLAGRGSTQSTPAVGHFGHGRDRPIYGQLVRVEKWGGNPPALLAATGDTAVVVPWDYGADCSTTPWGSRWVWLRSGDRMLLTPTLRERRFWVNGHPTFDAFRPQFDAYPVRYDDPVMGRQTRGLTVDQLFALFEVLPSAEEISKRGWAATAEATKWAGANPELASMYPARDIGMTVSWEAGDSHARMINSPLTGTYRFWLTYPNGRQRQFYVRTSDRPVGAWRILRPLRDERPSQEWLNLADGYQLRLWVAANERGLPTTPDWRKRYDFEMGIREVGDTTRASVVWRAEFETSGLYLFSVLQDPELDSLMSKHFAWLEAHYDSGTITPDPGRFVKLADGRLSFVQFIQLADSTQIIMRAERVSSATIRDTSCYSQAC